MTCDEDESDSISSRLPGSRALMRGWSPSVHPSIDRYEGSPLLGT